MTETTPLWKTTRSRQSDTQIDVTPGMLRMWHLQQQGQDRVVTQKIVATPQEALRALMGYCQSDLRDPSITSNASGLEVYSDMGSPANPKWEWVEWEDDEGQTVDDLLTL